MMDMHTIEIIHIRSHLESLNKLVAEMMVLNKKGMPYNEQAAYAHNAAVHLENCLKPHMVRKVRDNANT